MVDKRNFGLPQPESDPNSNQQNLLTKVGMGHTQKILT